MRKFVLVKPDRSKYLLQHALFGENVRTAFPSAAFDIEQAGNCLAVEANMAAIYHLLRVAEHGLRALARDRRIEIPKVPQ